MTRCLVSLSVRSAAGGRFDKRQKSAGFQIRAIGRVLFPEGGWKRLKGKNTQTNEGATWNQKRLFRMMMYLLRNIFGSTKNLKNMVL